MGTEAQNAANRVNAEKSTGPKSSEGKAVVARNAIKHGLTSSAIIVFGEDEAKFRNMRERLILEFEPVGAYEEALVERIIGYIWRLKRLVQIEAAILDIKESYLGEDHQSLSTKLAANYTFGLKPLSQLTRHEIAIERQLDRATTELGSCQAGRRELEKKQSDLERFKLMAEILKTKTGTGDAE